MKCCNKELTKPEIIDDIAYFVCSECGDVRVIENYRTYTTEEALNYLKEKYGFTLPKEYIKLSTSTEGKVVKLPPCENKSLKFYFGDGFYELGKFASVDPNSKNSICSTISAAREWGLNHKYVPLEGDGHTWLALDYSNSLTEPVVVVTETDEGNSLVVASTFNEFVSNLLKYDEVYDLDGNIIFNEKNT